MHVPVSYWKRYSRSAGALLNSLGAIALGAPVTFHYLPKTLNWSLMMSLLTFQHHVFSVHHGPTGDVYLHKPTHGAVIGAWFGAWQMPLDWERPWQEWPISVSYGAIAGHLVGLLASLGFVLACDRSQHIKRE